MLDYILELTERMIRDSKTLSPKDKETIYDNVSYALSQTKVHINATRNNNEDKASAVLANIWQRTAKHIKPIKNPFVQNLVVTVEEKSKYWSDPNNYDKELFDKFNMRITQVEKNLHKLCK